MLHPHIGELALGLRVGRVRMRSGIGPGNYAAKWNGEKVKGEAARKPGNSSRCSGSSALGASCPRT